METPLPPGNQCQFSVILTVKKCLLMFRGNPLCFILCPLKVPITNTKLKSVTETLQTSNHKYSKSFSLLSYLFSEWSSTSIYMSIAGQGIWFWPSTPLWWDPTWSTVSSSGALSTGKTWTSWSRSGAGPQKWSERWNTYPVRKGWDGVVQSGEEKAPGTPSRSLPVPEEGL